MDRISQDSSQCRVIIITATDTKYFAMLCDLLDSLEAHPESRRCRVGIIDVGLEADQISALEPRVSEIVPGKWDIPFPGCETAPRHRQAFTVTPFLREYFPGHDVYLWIDSDVWVQDWAAIEMYVRGALQDGMAAVPEIDRNYPRCTSDLDFKIYRKVPFVRGRIKWITTSLYQRMSRMYPKYISRRLMFAPVVNAGIFAITRWAPHWDAWQESYRAARIDNYRALSDQAALNHALYTRKVPLHRLPCTCNWLTCFRAPMLDEETGRLVEPSLPYAPIGLIHVTGRTKQDVYDVHALGGGKYQSQLNFRNFRELRAAVMARRNGELAESAEETYLS